MASDIFKVCTLDLKPMSSCTVNETTPSSFSGLSIEMFRSSSGAAMGWREGIDYQFECLDMDTQDVIDQELLPVSGSCDAFVAATTITSNRVENGVSFAYPYWSSSLAIISRASVKPYEGWGWIQPFTWDLWLAILITIISLPLLLLAFELLSRRKSLQVNEMRIGYMESHWHTFWLMMHGKFVDVRSPARIPVIVTAFIAMILGASYTANLAAFLTLRDLGAVNSVYGLAGKAVGTDVVYREQLLKRFGIATIPSNIASQEELIPQMDLIVRGSLIAFVIDAELAQITVATYPGCAIQMASDSIEPFEYGLAFSPNINESVVHSFSLVIMQMLEDGEMKGIADRFLIVDSACLSRSSQSGDPLKISFQEVYGLWIMLGASLGLGAILLIFVRRFNHGRKSWDDSMTTIFS